MFRTARMRKLNVITLDKYASPTVSALHDEGIVQINDISERIQQDPKLAELLKHVYCDYQPKVRHYQN